MPAVRVAPGDLVAMAVDDLVALSEPPELAVTGAGAGRVTIRLGDQEWTATVLSLDSAGARDASGLTARADPGAHVVVGNKLSADARAHLTDAGWSWFDRRVGAHLTNGGRTFDLRFVARDPSPVEAAGVLTASPRSDGPIRGRAGISYAAALLLAADDPPSMRAVGREVGLSPTAISNAAKLLAAPGLVVDGRPAIPDLFWALAEVWRPTKVAFVGAAPEPAQQSGWVLGGDGAALALGAPVFSTDERPTYWVATQAEARRAQRALGTADPQTRAATVAVPPTPLVITRAVDADPWPLAHPLFVALDLARDPGRGREILDQWHPEGVTRVWG
jgi:hypothetical protein